ncbi:MAG TPA: hypothetical protein VEK08_02420 [Planctomycetota bacterium]|nr:hypothetical protein [Planctomycetota bacterium]
MTAAGFIILTIGSLTLACVYGWVLRRIWRNTKSHPSGRYHFNFSILDYWTAIVGLTPTFLVIPISDACEVAPPFIPLIAFNFFAAQITGMLWVRIDFHGTDETVLRQWPSSLSIIAGSLLGLVLAIVIPIGIYISLASLPLWPIFLILWFILRKRIKPENRER